MIRWYYFIPLIGFLIYKMNGYTLFHVSIRKERNFLYYHNVVNFAMILLSILFLKFIL